MTDVKDRIIAKQDELIEVLEATRQKEKELHAKELEKTTDLYSGAVAFVAAERDAATSLANELKKDVEHWKNQASFWKDRWDDEHKAFVNAAQDRDQAIRDKGDLRRRNAELRNDNADLKSSGDALHANLRAARASKQETEEKLFQVQQECDKLKSRCEHLRKELVGTEAHEEAYRYERDVAKANEKTAVDNLAQALCECDELRSRLEHLQKCNEVQQDFIESICNLSAEEASLEEIMELCISYRRGQAYGKWMVYVVEHEGDEKVFTGWFKDYDKARESVDLMVARGCYEAWVEELIQ